MESGDRLINQVIIVGRMTRDPDLRYTPDGKPVANFTLAVNRNFKNGNGEYDADFIQCNIWRKPAESTVNYCRKGSLVGVTGRLQSRSFENKEGQKVYVTEVVADRVQFLEPKKESVPS